jgi:hypothetical protein
VHYFTTTQINIYFHSNNRAYIKKELVENVIWFIDVISDVIQRVTIPFHKLDSPICLNREQFEAC